LDHLIPDPIERGIREGDEKRGMKERMRSFKVKELRSNHSFIHLFILLRSKQRQHDNSSTSIETKQNKEKKTKRMKGMTKV